MLTRIKSVMSLALFKDDIVYFAYVIMEKIPKVSILIFAEIEDPFMEDTFLSKYILLYILH